jgi:hypothetical protein
MEMLSISRLLDDIAVCDDMRTVLSEIQTGLEFPNRIAQGKAVLLVMEYAREWYAVLDSVPRHPTAVCRRRIASSTRTSHLV